MNIIANEEIFYSSPYPEDVFCFSPSLTQLPSGRIIATFDLGGPGVEKMPGIRSQYGDYECGNQGKVYISDDCGKTWQHTADLPMLHARASMLVCKDDLLIMSRSGDESANSAHNSNLLTLHRVENFRNLIY